MPVSKPYTACRPVRASAGGYAVLPHARDQQHRRAIGELHTPHCNRKHQYPLHSTASTNAQHIQPRCRCSTRHWHASTKFGVGGASHVKRPTTPHANLTCAVVRVLANHVPSDHGRTTTPTRCPPPSGSRSPSTRSVQTRRRCWSLNSRNRTSDSKRSKSYSPHPTCT
jgi:hypothetical protein